MIIKRLQKKTKITKKWNKLEEKVVHLEKNSNALDQYRRKNNLVLSSIPENVSDNQLESTVTPTLSDIGVRVNSNDNVECHRFGKQETKSKKTIIRLVNRKFCRKALRNRKNVADLDNPKCQLRRSTKIFNNENFASMNESTAY